MSFCKGRLVPGSRLIMRKYTPPSTVLPLAIAVALGCLRAYRLIIPARVTLSVMRMWSLKFLRRYAILVVRFMANKSFKSVEVGRLEDALDELDQVPHGYLLGGQSRPEDIAICLILVVPVADDSVQCAELVRPRPDVLVVVEVAD